MGKLCFTLLLVLFLQNNVNAQTAHVNSINIKPVLVSSTTVVKDAKKVAGVVSVNAAPVTAPSIVLDTTVIVRPTYDLNVVERKD